MSGAHVQLSGKPITYVVVAKNTGDKPATITKAYQVLLTQEGVFPANSGLSATRISDTIATMKQYKILSGGTAPSESSLVNTGPIDAVLGKLGTQSGNPLYDD